MSHERQPEMAEEQWEQVAVEVLKKCPGWQEEHEAEEVQVRQEDWHGRQDEVLRK